MKKANKRKEPKRYRLSNISRKEIKDKYPDKIVDEQYFLNSITRKEDIIEVRP